MSYVSELDDGSLGYTKIIAHAQREPDTNIVVTVIKAERQSPRKQITELALPPTHNVFVRKSPDNSTFKPRLVMTETRYSSIDHVD